MSTHMFLSRNKKNIATFWLKKKSLIKSYEFKQIFGSSPGGYSLDCE